ncbi:MBL fold metallo-hydrolase [Tessaracoccus sp. OS52]|uniref:MBL fold metallo-hydrolase n=1 Tax=Tessaracoccus sp. OS52 TaxID=2886691 RepID=UPI001D1057F0|nr:MBL fold metallo-hydrolase [Tessaracoccus sp. OS52]MCC2592678.1 MBL fold metallo-hydrolase [Tessaracoccus sp. OS52]
MSATPAINWLELTPRVFVTTLEPAAVNVGLVVGDAAAMLVDAGSSPEQGEALLSSATARAGVPVTHVAVTHNHWDHWFGIAGMGAVTSIAHENLAITEPSSETLAKAAEQGLQELPRPTETFSIARAVDLGGQRVELVHFGGGHTNCDVFVLVPGENITFAGDMLEEGADPQFDPTSNISNWPTALDGVLGAANEHTRFVPGHGDVVDRNFGFIQRAHVGMLYGNTEYLIQQGTKLSDAAAAAEWPFSTETLAVALPLVYAELEAKGIKPRTQLPITGL